MSTDVKTRSNIYHKRVERVHELHVCARHDQFEPGFQVDHNTELQDVSLLFVERARSIASSVRNWIPQSESVTLMT
jgi:hypothetical protein